MCNFTGTSGNLAEYWFIDGARELKCIKYDNDPPDYNCKYETPVCVIAEGTIIGHCANCLRYLRCPRGGVRRCDRRLDALALGRVVKRCTLMLINLSITTGGSSKTEVAGRSLSSNVHFWEDNDGACCPFGVRSSVPFRPVTGAYLYEKGHEGTNYHVKPDAELLRPVASYQSSPQPHLYEVISDVTSVITP